MNQPQFNDCVIIIVIDSLAFSNAHFGSGSGSIFLDNVGCDGSENNLLDCYYAAGSGCGGHTEDVGVRCQGMNGNW